MHLFWVTAYLIREVREFEALKDPNASHNNQLALTAEELTEAKKLWIAQAQSLLTRDDNFDLWKKRFGLFLDETGLWRCGGRLANADILYSTKHPLLLPRSHPITAQSVREAHECIQHNGVKESLTELQTKY